MERKYYLLTIYCNSNYENIWYEGNLTMFLLIEKELGRDTIILNHLEITEEEYNYAQSSLKSNPSKL